MARVARRAVSISEPAQSLATSFAMRLGLAQAVEESGNPVMRLTVEEIDRELELHAFRSIRPHRYAMFYRHLPGMPMHVFSKPVLRSLAMRTFNLGNRIFGHFGNKLAVQAVRIDP